MQAVEVAVACTTVLSVYGIPARRYSDVRPPGARAYAQKNATRTIRKIAISSHATVRSRDPTSVRAPPRRRPA